MHEKTNMNTTIIIYEQVSKGTPKTRIKNYIRIYHDLLRFHTFLSNRVK